MDQSPSQTDSALEQAVAFVAPHGDRAAPKPQASDVVDALLAAEKTAKQQKVKYRYDQLLGTWRLGFITGTKKTRERAGVALGAGRFLPPWVQIQIAYTAESLKSQAEMDDAPPDQNRGTTINTVKLGGLQLALTGPVQFWPKQNILAFDFTRMTVKVLGQTLYDSYIRKGAEREASFYQQGLKEQAFFAYFCVQPDWIAARGRGGGLAFWTRA